MGRRGPRIVHQGKLQVTLSQLIPRRRRDAGRDGRIVVGDLSDHTVVGFHQIGLNLSPVDHVGGIVEVQEAAAVPPKVILPRGNGQGRDIGSARLIVGLAAGVAGGKEGMVVSPGPGNGVPGLPAASLVDR